MEFKLMNVQISLRISYILPELIITRTDVSIEKVSSYQNNGIHKSPAIELKIEYSGIRLTSKLTWTRSIERIGMPVSLKGRNSIP